MMSNKPIVKLLAFLTQNKAAPLILLLITFPLFLLY